MLLLISVFALFLGPLTYRLLQRQSGWLDLLDAFIFVTISGLVLLHILPEILHNGGLMVLVLMAAGVLAPSWIEKYFHEAAHQVHQTALFLGVLGLVLHAGIDGSVLIIEQGDHTGWLLALGVLLHRFPVGLTIWWLLRPQYGRMLPMLVLLSMSATTLIGAFFANYSLAQADVQWLAWLQAFVMGSIMHVVLHRPYLHAHAQHSKDSENKYAAGIGSIVGIIVLASVLMPHWLGYVEHPQHHNEQAALHISHLSSTDDSYQSEKLYEVKESHIDETNNTALTLINFTNIALYSAPMLLAAYFLSGLMHYFKPKFSVLPPQGSQSFFKDALKGISYGLPLPVCSPSACKMYQQLLASGASQTFAMAFLIAAPIVGFDALLISLPLLGTQMLLIRVVLAAIFALAIAWFVARHFKIPSVAAETVISPRALSRSRFIDAIKQGYQHQLDHTAPWVLLGWTLAATLPATSVWAFFEHALWLQVLVMIIVAFPLALCATGITPVIAVLLLAGLSPGAAIAFFLIAPTISIELLKIFKQQQGFFTAMSLAMLMLSGAFLIGLGVNQYIAVPPLSWLEQRGGYSWWQVASLVIISILYLSSLLRRGVRSFVAELLPKSLLKRHHHHH